MTENSKKPNPEFDSYLYKLRQLVENLFARVKNFRKIATRYERWRYCSQPRFEMSSACHGDRDMKMGSPEEHIYRSVRHSAASMPHSKLVIMFYYFPLLPSPVTKIDRQH